MKPRSKWSLVAFFILMLGVMSPGVFAQRATFATPILVVNASFLNVRTGPGAQYSVLVTVVGGTELPVLGVANDKVWYQVATDGGAGWVNVEFTLPRGDFSNVPLVDFNAEAVAPSLGQGGGGAGTSSVVNSGDYTGISIPGGNLYSEPRSDSIVIRSALNDDPNIIYVLLGQTRDSQNINWYAVNIPDVGTGWVNKVNFRPLACGTDIVGVTTLETPIVFDGISTQQSFLVPVGDEFYLRGFKLNYTIVERSDGLVGLIDTGAIAPRSSSVVSLCDSIPANLAGNVGQGGGGASTEPVQPVLAGNVAVVNTGNLNVRSGPSAGFATIAVVPGGTTLQVLGRAKDDVWFLVGGTFGQGWVNNQFVLFRGTYSTVPLITEDQFPTITSPSVAALGQGGGAVAPTSVQSGSRVTGVSIPGGNLYAEASSSSIVIRSALNDDPNTIYPLLGQVRDPQGVTWFLVNVPNVGTGWVNKANYRPLACGTDIVGVTTLETPIVFDGISTQQSFLVPVGDEFYLRGFKLNYTIVERADGLVGLIDTGAIAPRSSSVVSLCDNLPVTSSGVTGVTQPSTGTTTTAQAVVTGNRAVVNTGSLNIRSGPSAGFAPVATVAGGTELAVVGRASDGVWLLVSGSFGQGWVNSQFVLFRGDFSTVPVIDF
jgi:uncharacterized protein YraI